MQRYREKGPEVGHAESKDQVQASHASILDSRNLLSAPLTGLQCTATLQPTRALLTQLLFQPVEEGVFGGDDEIDREDP